MHTLSGRRIVHTRVLFRSRAAAHCSKAHDPETSTFAMTELDLLKKSEYIHVVLNHLPIYGTMLGALALAISLILRSRAAQITALILTLIAGASAYPVFVTGQRAYKTIRGVSDDAEPIGSMNTWSELKRR